MSQPHKLHEGELSLQRRQGTPSEVTSSLPNYIDRNMPEQHADFFSNLDYLPLATLDQMGRPWVSILVTHSDNNPALGIRVSGHNQISVTAETSSHDPLLSALNRKGSTSPDETQLFAGVGVDFRNRRRNKMAGSIDQVSIGRWGNVHLELTSDQHLGNCPKYITIRNLEYEPRKAELCFEESTQLTISLPEAAKELINQASTAFLATKHTAKICEDLRDEDDMGLNHRGGAPGFIRLYEDKTDNAVATYLVLPDHSGNRFYQSLGNIETDKEVGLVIPDFETGNILYVTGNAENLMGDDAETVMRRTSLLTRIRVTACVFVKGGLNLRLTSEEQFSPYNPPVKYLRREREELGQITSGFASETPITATLITASPVSESIATFTFELSSSVKAPLPGGFGVFDFSEILGSGYRHMSEENPQLVNEDFIRTWTLSNASNFDAEDKRFSLTRHISVTVKRKEGGLLSNFLHEYFEQLIQKKIPVIFKGTGLGFSCFSSESNGALRPNPSKMLWIAGGVGITPFMSMWDGLIAIDRASSGRISSDVVLLFSGRKDDLNILEHFLSSTQIQLTNISLKILAFQSGSKEFVERRSDVPSIQDYSPTGNIELIIKKRRVGKSDFLDIHDLGDRQVFMCGPESFMRAIEASLGEAGIDKGQIHKESFFF